MAPFGPAWGAPLPDALLVAIALAALIACLAGLAVAAWRHRLRLRAVPVRIHVGGTRGKSTTTRLIAAGLRAGGLKVLAKATGSEPRVIDLDGTEAPWPRRGPASIREQQRFLALAARRGCDAVVVECMAIRPELIWASERHLVRATSAVITNARPDHAEELGDDPRASAASLAWLTPERGNLFVADEAADDALRARAASRGATLCVVETSDLDPLAANQALALAVCEAHGVAREIAAPVMARAAGDPGGYFEHWLTIGGKRVRFRNAFACNDVGSLDLLWRSRENGHAPVVVLNARADRPSRSRQFIDFLAQREPRPRVFIAGDRLAVTLARRAGLAPSRRLARGAGIDETLAMLVAAAEEGGSIWGIGNYQGFGARLIGAMPALGARC